MQGRMSVQSILIERAAPMGELLDRFQSVSSTAGSLADESLWQSEELHLPLWDSLLGSVPLGQFQQSSSWAFAKSADGWQVSRFVVQRSGVVTDGFQVLWKSTRFGRVGYVSKGPVIFRPELTSWDRAVRAMIEAAGAMGFRALLVQPPDRGIDAEPVLQASGFVREHLQQVIDATLWFDLSGSEADILQHMPGYNRTLIRQAERRGIEVYEGKESDLELFYDLMLDTCRRQSTKPNPSSLEGVRTVWRAFAPSNAFRMTFARVGERPLAALSSIRFGDRVTLWKKGARDEASKQRANHLLYFEALVRAQRMGAAFCDFYSLRRDIAQRMQAGEKLSEEQSSSRDRFHIGFGGTARLLPRSWIYIPNRILRWGYTMSASLGEWRKRPSRVATAIGSKLGRGSGCLASFLG